MADLHIDVELLNNKKTYHPGEDVSGTVRIFANRSFSCRTLVVCLRWETDGRGDRDSVVESETELFSGEWFEGEDQEYPSRTKERSSMSVGNSKLELRAPMGRLLLSRRALCSFPTSRALSQ